jgi:hypothetical protein
MLPNGFLYTVKLVLVGSCLLLLIGLQDVSQAEAPIYINSQVDNEVLITVDDISDRIDILCRKYNFPYFSLMKWLAAKESSMGQDLRCGDDGLSCGLYQYKTQTWNEFQKRFDKHDLDRDNTHHQIEMTIIALQNGMWYHWSPLKNNYNTDPIK